MKTILNMRIRVVEITMSSRLRYFLRMNPPIFLGSNVNEDPHGFLDGVYKILSSMGLHLRRRLSWRGTD